MALSLQNFTLANTLVVENAYIRIDTVHGNKNSITLDVNVYASEHAALNYLPYVEKKSYSFTPDVTEVSLNYHKQGYEYLKSLDEFLGSVDC